MFKKYPKIIWLCPKTYLTFISESDTNTIPFERKKRNKVTDKIKFCNMEVVLIEEPILTKLKNKTKLYGSKKKITDATGIPANTIERVKANGRATTEIATKLTDYLKSIK